VKGFALYADKNQLIVRQREPITSGSVNVYMVQFAFSGDWEGLTRTAVFKAGGVSRSVLLGADGQCVIPWETLISHGQQLTVGVYGVRDGSMVLPTIWVGLGTILKGVECGEGAQPPMPNLWEQRLSAKQDKITGAPGQIVGFDENGQLVAQTLPTGTQCVATDAEVQEMLDEIFC